MPTVFVDGQGAEVPVGSTVLHAAKKLGIEIPTLCYHEDIPPFASCMLCLVQDQNTGKILPSCSAPAEEGMHIDTRGAEVREARKAALELLLSEHAGDCFAPCHRGCPAHMDIPRMLGEIMRGDLHKAIITIKKDIALPATLGRVCSAPCEKLCRRGQHDRSVSICLLKRQVADWDLGDPYLPDLAVPSGNKVAIVGAGPAGLSAAYYLRQQGHTCAIFDGGEKPGGGLCGAENLPGEVLAAEIDVIRRLGVEFHMGTEVGKAVGARELLGEFAAVVIATGRPDAKLAAEFGIELTRRGVKADPETFATSQSGIFAVGGAVHPGRMAVRSVQEGKLAAHSAHLFLTGREVKSAGDGFDFKLARLTEGELGAFARGYSWRSAGELPPASGDAQQEAARCFQCHCLKAGDCKLRTYAEEYGADPKRYSGARRPLHRVFDHEEIVYESGKCIQCGLCVEIARKMEEPLGLAFIGRGFDVRVDVPFCASLADGLKKAARECARACPTGALSLRQSEFG